MRIAVVVAVFLAALPCIAEEGPAPRPGYGGQIGLVDLASVISVGAGIGTGVAPLAVAGLGAFALGGPIVHWSHGYLGRGFGSLALRTLLPITAGYAGGLIASATSGNCTGDSCAFYRALGGAGVGFVVGAASASLIDMLWLARSEDPAPPPRVAVGFTGKGLLLAARF